jgi:hypothetical protein
LFFVPYQLELRLLEPETLGGRENPGRVAGTIPLLKDKPDWDRGRNDFLFSRQCVSIDADCNFFSD